MSHYAEQYENDYYNNATKTGEMLTPGEMFNECFSLDYVTGDLVWRARPATHFNGSPEARDEFNNANAGRIAGKSPYFGYPSVTISGRTFTPAEVVCEMLLSHKRGEI